MRGPLGPIALHDSLAVYWVWADQFAAELARGNLYPRWLPASDAGLGTPVFYFYPPLAFYLAALFRLAGSSTYASLIAVFGSAFAVSGIACWHWLKGRANHPLLGAAFFMAAPYHLFNYVDRGAVAESLATAFIPLVAIGLRRIAEGRGIALCAVAYAALIATHLPLALLVSLFLIAPYAIRHRRHLMRFVVATGAGLALASIYLLPALALGDAHDVAQLYRTPNLRTEYWSLFSGHWSDPTFVIIFAIVAAISGAAALLALHLRDRWAAYALGIAFVVAGVVPFLWALPMLSDVQFPYRALPLAEFALATAIARLPNDPRLALLPATLVLSVSLLIAPGLYSVPGDVRRLEAMHPDVYEYLPNGVIKPHQATVRLADVLAPRVPPPQVSGMVVEPRFYFPSWSCGAAEPRTQLLMHEPSCRPGIVWTLSEKLGAVISLVGLIFVAGLGVVHRRTLPQR